jgi:23S rRNA G2445 N2-methylase RlmL
MLANQLTKAILRLNDLAMVGSAIFTAMDMNGIVKDAIVDDAKKKTLLSITAQTI